MDKSIEMAESYFCTGRKVLVPKTDLRDTVRGIIKLDILSADKKIMIKELKLSNL